MRILLLCCWSLLPLAAVGYHFGPGQPAMRVDLAAAHAQEADRLAEAGELGPAIDAYGAALEALPPGADAQEWRLRLERAKLMIRGGGLPAAYDDLAGLQESVDAAAAGATGEDAAAQREALASLGDEVDEAFANARYYMTWLMRLEGRPETEWRPEIEAARQSYRRLAEENGGQAARSHAESTEAAIRLARLGLDDLQAMPLPSQCKGCKSSDSQCCGKCDGKGKKKSRQKKRGESDARGASSGPPPDGSGA